MKKIITLLVLITGITGEIYAQDKTSSANTDKTFDPPPNSITRKFIIDLGKGNKMQLELGAFEDIGFIKNVDSLVKVFLHDMEPLKDSLSNELLSKRIDYVSEPSGRKKIRIQQYPPKGSSFLVNQGDLAALKLEQDTIYLSGTVPQHANEPISGKKDASNYYRIGFFVNRLSELTDDLNSILNEKIAAIQQSDNKKWLRPNGENWQIRNGDPAVFAKQPHGYVSGPGDYLQLNAGTNLQNYKNYFVPSFTLNASAFFKNNRYKNEISVAWEPNFLFAKNSQGNLQTFRNDFIILTLGHEPLRNKKLGNGPHFGLFQQLSVGYLAGRKGDFFDAHSFRLGTGSIDWIGGKIKLTPILYFHDFFKNVTPGLRVSVNF